MKQILLLLAVFAAAFAATLLFTRDLFRPAIVPDPVDVPAGEEPADAVAKKRRADIQRTMVNEDGTAAALGAVDVGEAAKPTTGEIELAVRCDDGLVPADLEVQIFPPGAEPRLLGGGRFLFDGLVSGVYVVGGAAEGYLPRRPEEVRVEAGRKYEAVVWLDKGFKITGVVVEDVDQRPIQGAHIDFNGMAQATSDARGAFATGYTSPRALDVITLTHDDYDRNQVVHAPMPDSKDLRLAMSRGRATVTGRVAWPSGRDVPPSFRVRVWRFVMEGHEELRRERTFTGTSAFEIRGVMDGTNILEVSFPGTNFATRRIDFDLKRAPALHFDVDVNVGGTIEGAYVTPSNLVASQPVVLFDSKGHVMAETKTDADGKFRVDFVPAGDYGLRVGNSFPPIQTERFAVEDFKVRSLVVEGPLGRLK